MSRRSWVQFPVWSLFCTLTLQAYDFPLKQYGIDFSDLPDVTLVATEAKPGQYVYVCQGLYDSGCTQHISPYLSDFNNYVEIPPKAFCAVNKQSFSATGKGEMVIDIPDSAQFSQLHLTEVLYVRIVIYHQKGLDEEIPKQQTILRNIYSILRYKRNTTKMSICT